MLKLIAALLCLVLAAAGTSTAHAAPVDLFLTGWNNETLEEGFGGGIKGRSRFLIFSMDLRASYLYYNQPELGSIPLELTAQLDLGLIYLGGGGGYYMFTRDWENRWGATALAGAMIKIGGLGVFAEGLYTWMDAVEKESGEKLGQMDGFRVNLGVSLGR